MSGVISNCERVGEGQMTSVARAQSSSPADLTKSKAASEYIEKLVHDFFTSSPFVKTEDLNTELLLSKTFSDPSTLSQTEILQQCRNLYFQVLRTHYELNGVGGASAFLPRESLSEAQQDAKGQALEMCKVLSNISFTNCVAGQIGTDFIQSVESYISKINVHLKKENDKRQFQYLNRNRESIRSEFKTMLEIRYRLLLSVENSSKTDKPSQLQKFYQHQQLTEFVKTAVDNSTEKCNQFVRRCGANDKIVAHAFNIVKKLIKDYGKNLVSINEANFGLFQNHINNVIYTFRSSFDKTIKKAPFTMTTAVIQSMIKTEMDKCLHKITVTCRETVVDNSSEFEAVYKSILEDEEKELIEKCLKLAVIEKENATKSFFERVEIRLEFPDLTVWISDEAQRSRVTDKHALIVKNGLQEAFEKIRKECEGLIQLPMDDGNNERDNAVINDDISSAPLPPESEVSPRSTSSNDSATTSNMTHASNSRKQKNNDASAKGNQGGEKRCRCSI